MLMGQQLCRFVDQPKYKFYIVYFQVLGVFGVSIFSLHKPLDLVNGIVIDDLHCLYLGVTKTLLSLWFDDKYKSQVYHIGTKVHVSSRLSLIWMGP